jgi:hypothetical protein
MNISLLGATQGRIERTKKYSMRFMCRHTPSLLSRLLLELTSSCEAANCAATQELSSILRNPTVHYHVHKSPPLVRILSQINPIHTVPSYLSKIHFNIAHRPTSWSS